MAAAAGLSGHLFSGRNVGDFVAALLAERAAPEAAKYRSNRIRRGASERPNVSPMLSPRCDALSEREVVRAVRAAGEWPRAIGR